MISFLLKEQRQDLRSLSIFRILLGLYILYDIYSRLQHGRLSLLWYTSSSTSSFLRPDDSPHKSPIHRIWFYRGSEALQIFLFALTAILASMYALGYSYSFSQSRWRISMSASSSAFPYEKLLLWLNVTAMQCRNMHAHDGSDTFCRHLLLWSCFLPMNRVWSLDAYLHRKHQQDGDQRQQKHPRTHQEVHIENTTAVWGLRLQIVFMYLGTVLSRTTDKYGFSFQQLSQSEWLPPSLSAVYYSLNDTFATRDNWLGDLVRSNFMLTKILTISAMVIESMAPIACLIMGVGFLTNKSEGGNSGSDSDIRKDYKYAFIPPLLLFKLHLGLLVLMNLPNWQFVGMIATTIWIPISCWDMWQQKLSLRFPRLVSPPRITPSLKTREKKEEKIIRFSTKRTGAKYLLTNFLFVYMIYNFAGERGWIKKHDGGDVGEFLRFSQYWVMFSSLSKNSHDTILTGTISKKNDVGFDDIEEVDVWRWMTDGQLTSIDLESRKTEKWTNMTHIYPSPRLERMFHQFSSSKNRKVINYFLQKLCTVGPFDELTLICQSCQIQKPSVFQRFLCHESKEQATFRVEC